MNIREFIKSLNAQDQTSIKTCFDNYLNGKNESEKTFAYASLRFWWGLSVDQIAEYKAQ